MNIKTQILVAIIVLLAMAALVNMIRKNKLELKYCLLWFLLGVAILVFDCFPWLTTKLASVIGIGQPINLLFFSGFCFSLLIIFSLTAAVSRFSVKIKKLTQEIALLEKKIEGMEGTKASDENEK